MTQEEEVKILEGFAFNNAELSELERMLGGFNIFEAIGVVRYEIRHSNILAYLLDPNGKHGLGDKFVKRFLLNIFRKAGGTGSITPLQIELWDLMNLQVHREYEHIDILLQDDTNRFAVIIENKIDSPEIPKQLEQYWNTMNGKLVGKWSLEGIYLTPNADLPSCDHYVPIGYESIALSLGEVIRTNGAEINPEVRSFINHYLQILQRHIMPESDVAKLRHAIYSKHKEAINLIIAHRPDQSSILREGIYKLLGESADKILMDDSDNKFIRFSPKVWDIPTLKTTEPKEAQWTSSGRIILMEFSVQPLGLFMGIYIAPGGPIAIRERLFNIAKQVGSPFKTGKALWKSWTPIYKRVILDEAFILDATEQEILEELHDKLEAFMRDEFPILTKSIINDFIAA